MYKYVQYTFLLIIFWQKNWMY